MRRPYQLSKIGKECRKSGSFRFCGLGDGGRSPAAVLLVGPQIKGAIFDQMTSAESRAVPDRGRRAGNASIACKECCWLGFQGFERKKKLPQVGQEPVEAVESRPISPDGLYNTRKSLGRKDIFKKSAEYSGNSPFCRVPVIFPRKVEVLYEKGRLRDEPEAAFCRTHPTCISPGW
jgi:hypothetical protein